MAVWERPCICQAVWDEPILGRRAVLEEPVACQTVCEELLDGSDIVDKQGKVV